MEKRYQVFVSSTFKDLEHERSHVIQALLELDCIPCGMELFPAADEDQWSYIQGIIDDCDYYVVVLAGKYGSVSPVTGKSYTQMEYEYALSQGKPTIAFLYKNLQSLSVDRSETDEAKRKLLAGFRSEVETKLCKHWESADQLHGVVLQSMIHLMKRRPAVGWVRADRVPDESSSQEIARLRRYIEELEGQIKHLDPNNSSSIGIEFDNLAQGEDIFEVVLYYIKESRNPNGQTDFNEIYSAVPLTWDDIFYILAENVYSDGVEHRMEAFLLYKIKDLLKKEGIKNYREYYIQTDCMNSIKVQMRLLGLMDFSENLEPDLATKSRTWHLTPRGETMLLRKQAVTRITDQ